MKFYKINHGNASVMINKFEKPNSIIEKMMALPNDKFVIITKECEIQIFQVNKNKNIPPKPLFTLSGHSNNITGIILLRNKKYFATASDDSTIKIWDFEKGLCYKTISTKGKPFLICKKFCGTIFAKYIFLIEFKSEENTSNIPDDDMIILPSSGN